MLEKDCLHTMELRLHVFLLSAHFHNVDKLFKRTKLTLSQHLCFNEKGTQRFDAEMKSVRRNVVPCTNYFTSATSNSQKSVVTILATSLAIHSAILHNMMDCFTPISVIADPHIYDRIIGGRYSRTWRILAIFSEKLLPNAALCVIARWFPSQTVKLRSTPGCLQAPPHL